MKILSQLLDTVQELLCCPICKTPIQKIDGEFRCTHIQCGGCFPIINGIPVLLNEKASLFSIQDFTSQKSKTMVLPENTLRAKLSRLIPTIDQNLKAEQNYKKFVKLLLASSDRPRVLVIGCGNLGKGMESLLKSSLELVETDVSLGDRTMIICDAHDLPFSDQAFDGIIIQAVLEHVVDPYRCVEEIHRVLKPEGLIYAETPFMQQVHMGRYDFTRFTHLGHRRLFRNFEEVESGAVGGPGTALAWSYQYFLLSFTQRKILRAFIKVFTRFTSFYLQYLDYFLIDKPGSFDAASGYYFMGQKMDTTLSDQELIKLYKGNIIL